jgi:uncharacterized protein YbaP (TraB family)
MMRRRINFLCGLILICLIGTGLIAQSSTAPTAQLRATEKPFLWRIDGSVPSYLYGTVHVPDPRVLELPEVVRRAFDASDVFNAEIPLDAATQAGLMSRVTLPPGQDLRKIVGEDVFARLVRAISKPLAGAIPPGASELLAATLSPLKPWAAMSQLELLEYLPDILAGRQPLDATLYSMATGSRKEVGSLETVDEQVGVFEGFTQDEQVRMLISTLDDIEKPRPGGVSAARELVDSYLAGDLNALARELNDEYPDDPVLKNKMTVRVIDDRNTKMATRIAERIGKKPARSYFFAVGALHYAGDTGILAQLSKKGFKITRLTPRDAATIVRKPAA